MTQGCKVCHAYGTPLDEKRLCAICAQLEPTLGDITAAQDRFVRESLQRWKKPASERTFAETAVR